MITRGAKKYHEKFLSQKNDWDVSKSLNIDFAFKNLEFHLELEFTPAAVL